MTEHPDPPWHAFARWDGDDALDALYRAGLDVHDVEQAHWPASAPQPRTQRQAFTFRTPGAVDPHLLLVFDDPDGLEAWRLWLVRFWKARPYLSVRDNVLLLVSRDLTERQAGRLHTALARLEPAPERTSAAPSVPAPPSVSQHG
jgi:hypothetical protein